MSSKIEEYYTAGQFDLFYIELKKFSRFVIRRHFFIDRNREEDLCDELIERVYVILRERPHEKGRSDFRSYLYSIMRNGLSSYGNKHKREILSADPRAELEDLYEDNHSFLREVSKPTFQSEFLEYFSENASSAIAIFEEMVVLGDLNMEEWDKISSTNQNCVRVPFWKYWKEMNS